MNGQLDAIGRQVGKRNFDAPPLHLWNPPLSGEIDIRITADGDWLHEGRRIERDAIVRLFASILRREEDGEYYLVTPGEKWRLRVDLHPLVATDVEQEASGVLHITLNTGKRVVIDEEHPLFLEPAVGGVAGVRLDHGLSAIFSRAAWYRLVEYAESVDGATIVRSGNYCFRLDTGGGPP